MIHTPPMEAPEPGAEYLASTRFLDCESEPLQRFARETTAGEASDLGRAVKLFYAVRDGWRYDPFGVRLTPEEYVASNVLAAGRGVEVNFIVADLLAPGWPPAALEYAFDWVVGIFIQFAGASERLDEER